MRHRLLTLCSALSLLLCVAANHSRSGPADVSLADFSGALPSGLRVYNGKVSHESAGGVGCMRLAAEGGGGKYATVVLPVKESLNLARFDSLSSRIRVEGDGPTLKALWLAQDAAGRTLFQRQFELTAGGEWQTVAWPRSHWRWGSTAVGSWSEIRHLALVVEPAVRNLWVDGVRLHRGAPDDGGKSSDLLLNLAFNGRAPRVAEADGLLVATDAVTQLNDEDVRRLVSQMQQSRKFIRRLLGQAVRPIDAPRPPTLLVFKDAEGHKQFLERLARHDAVNIVPPAGLDGHTIEDIAITVFDPRLGASNVAFLHESFHAVLAHDARLVPNNPANSWLHEALAVYLQLGAYPKSMPPGVLAFNFPKGVSEGKTLFRPLRKVLTEKARPRDYAQLATVGAFLIEEKPTWLPTLARALADGETTEQALGRCGTTFDEVERTWLEWGRWRFTAETDNAKTPPFQLPPEFGR